MSSCKKYFIHLAYKGTNYQGWQRQKNGLGIQEIVEDALSRMFKQKINLHACGRTDAGVHASQFFCHTMIKEPWGFDAVFRINKMLPTDISVYDFIPVADSANAQLDALTRTYDYHIHTTPNPFLAELSTFYEITNLDITAMQSAVKLLTQYSDFRSFCKQPDLYKTTLCEVSSATLIVDESQTRLNFQITANRFLKAMVRILVANLIQIGKQEMELDTFEAKLKNPQLSQQPLFAYPQGLYLSKVVYPYLELVTMEKQDV